MAYFSSKEVKLLVKDQLSDPGCIEGKSKVAVQVAKNSFQTGREISEILSAREIEVHILADSDRCCIDWVAVVHSQPDKVVIKRSFSCPLLYMAQSKKIEKKYEIYQYIPEIDNLPKEFVENGATPREDLLKYKFYLAVDILFMSGYERIKKYLERTLSTEIEEWTYGKEVEERHIVLVVSENEGFKEYFKENCNSIVLTVEEMQRPEETLSRIEEEEKAMQRNRMKLLIKKMSVADTLKNSARIGIVFTSADHMGLIDLISKYLDMNNKKFYQFYINGLKPNKLGNFVGIDAFVVIQCPFSSFRFEENILAVRPYDLLLAFKKDWDGKYITNLEVAHREITEEIEKEEEVENIEITAIEIKSAINSLKLAKDEIYTKEMAQKYFQTGEYMKDIILTIKEEIPETSNDKLVKGYAGIPTEYIKE